MQRFAAGALPGSFKRLLTLQVQMTTYVFAQCHCAIALA